MNDIVVSSQTFEQWKERGLQLASNTNNLQWDWGKWWNEGHKKWDRKAEEFIKTLPLKRQTLRVYGEVERRVKNDIRMSGLSFSHHQVVAPESPEIQAKWLNRAEEEQWSREDLKQAMRDDPETKKAANKKKKKLSATAKRLAPIKKIIDHLIEMIDQPSKTLIPQSLIHRELLILKEAINKFN